MIEKLKRTDDDCFRWQDENGCDWQTKMDYIGIEILGFCGCGNPESVIFYIYNMLKKLELEEYGAYENFPYMFFVYWANHKGFAEHGTTARCSWLTANGKELINDIEIAMAEYENDRKTTE